jgi:hypothetical protein
VWYNDTANTLKFQYENVSTAGSWSTGGNLNSARSDLASTIAASPTSSLIAGGGSPGRETEKYNGTSWTEVNDLNTGRFSLRGAGDSNTAAIAFGGYGLPPTGNVVTNATELWNGSNWTEVNNLNTGRQASSQAGTSTSGLTSGGSTDTATVGNTESWNGTNWTEVNDLNTARSGLTGFGLVNTAAIAQGSNAIPTGSLTELWNGTNWTETTDINTPRRTQSGAGVYTSGLVFGGETPGAASVGNTETWNGSAWTETTDLNTAVRSAGSSGTSSGTGTASPSALCIGGLDSPGSNVTTTQEWTGPGVPVGAWSTETSMNTARKSLGGTGANNTAAIAYGGNPSVVATEVYNGTNWTEVNNLNSGRSVWVVLVHQQLQ